MQEEKGISKLECLILIENAKNWISQISLVASCQSAGVMLVAGARWRWLSLNRIDGAAVASLCTLTTWFENLARFN